MSVIAVEKQDAASATDGPNWFWIVGFWVAVLNLLALGGGIALFALAYWQPIGPEPLRMAVALAVQAYAIQAAGAVGFFLARRGQRLWRLVLRAYAVLHFVLMVEIVVAVLYIDARSGVPGDVGLGIVGALAIGSAPWCWLMLHFATRLINHVRAQSKIRWVAVVLLVIGVAGYIGLWRWTEERRAVAHRLKQVGQFQHMGQQGRNDLLAAAAKSDLLFDMLRIQPAWVVFGTLGGASLRPPATDDDLRAFARHAGELTRLTIGGDKVTDAGATALAVSSRLESISFSGPKLTDAGALPFVAYRFIKSAVFYRIPITDATLDTFPNDSMLTRLVVQETDATGAGLARLSRLGALQMMTIDSRLATPEFFAALPKFAALRSFQVVGSGKRLPPLVGPTNIAVLMLENVGVDDAWLACLRNLPRLSYVSLTKTRITPACFRQLRLLPGLSSVFLDETVIERGALDAFNAEFDKRGGGRRRN